MLIFLSNLSMGGSDTAVPSIWTKTTAESTTYTKTSAQTTVWTK